MRHETDEGKVVEKNNSNCCFRRKKVKYLWEIIKIILYYTLAITITIAMIAIIIFTFMGLIITLSQLFKQTEKTFTGCFTSIFMGCLGIVVFLIITFIGLAITVFVLNFSESEDFEHRLDKQYEAMTDIEKSNEEHILVTVKKVGSFKGGRRSTPASIDLYMKNYHDVKFEGTITLHIMLNGESIAQKELDIDLEVEDFYYVVVFPSDFDIGDKSWRNIWGKVELDYTLDGEFTQ